LAVSGHAKQEALSLRHFVEDVGPELAEDLAADPPGLDDSGGLEARHVPAHERLTEPDGLDQIAYGSPPFGQPPHDAEAIHVRKRLVENAQLPQIVGLVDDRCDGCPDVRG